MVLNQQDKVEANSEHIKGLKKELYKLKENYERMFGSIKEDWWDDMSPENRAQYIKDHPGSKQAQSTDDEADDKMKSNDRAADDEADDMDRDARFAADDEESESELDALDKKIKSTEARMNMAASNWSDPREQDVAYELRQDLEKLQADREKLAGGNMGRTGNELNQETLMIDGKQYRRISEKTSKPKYKFSELYKRFKK